MPIILLLNVGFIFLVIRIGEFVAMVLTNHGLQCKLLLKLVRCDCRGLEGLEKAGDCTMIAFLKRKFESVHHRHGTGWVRTHDDVSNISQTD